MALNVIQTSFRQFLVLFVPGEILWCSGNVLTMLPTFFNSANTHTHTHSHTNKHTNSYAAPIFRASAKVFILTMGSYWSDS